jgi:hypothetical protein
VSPLLFVRDVVHVKSIMMEWGVNREPLTFYTLVH